MTTSNHSINHPETVELRDRVSIKIILWMLFTFSALLFYFINRESFTPENLYKLFGQYNDLAFIVYVAASFLRGFTLIPSTPFVIAGTLLFPKSLFLVLLVSMCGIVFSGTLIFYLADYLGFSRIFNNKYPDEIAGVNQKLQSPFGMFFIFAWAFFPFVPTDLICYVAGTAKINYLKFLIALVSGEIIIVSIYIFSFQSIKFI